MKKKIIEKEYSPKFEIVLQQRNHIGEITGKTVSYTTDDCCQLDEFYQRNCFREKKVDDKQNSGRTKTRRHNKKDTNSTRNNEVQ